MKARNGQDTCRRMWRTGRWAVFMLAALAVLTTQSSLTSATRALPRPETPPTVVGKTALELFQLSAPGGTVNGRLDGVDWGSAMPGYNIARTFKNGGGQTFMFLLNSNTGKAQIRRVMADGMVEQLVVWSTLNGVIADLRCTSAEFVRQGGVTYLLTHNSLTGQIRTFRMNENGSLNLGSMTVDKLDDWKDKDLFSLYLFNGSNYLLGYNPWTGSAVVYSITGQKIGTDTWTRGWTSVDHLTIGGQTYRAFYKAAGDPQKKPGESGDQLGRFIIQRIGAGGIEGENLFDEPVGPNYSAVRFVPLSNGQGGWNYRVYFYQRSTGNYFSAGFDTQTGLSTPLNNGQIKDDEGVCHPHVDMEPYTVGTQTFLAFINADNSKPFNYDQAEQMGRIIHDELVNKTVGYQFMLAQSGRVIYSRYWGKSSLGNLPGEQVNMTARTPINLGSASKMITTATVLKLADGNAPDKVELDEAISKQIDPDKYLDNQLNAWVKQRTVRNLLTHTTGISESTARDCNTLADYKMDCKDFFAAEPDLAYDLFTHRGEWEYNNDNFSAARQVIEYKTGIETTEQLKNKTYELWAGSLGIEGMTPAFDNKIFYFGPCNGAAECYEHEGRYWLRGQSPETWSKYGGSGGWSASARDMIEFLGALRYQKILSKSLNDQLLDTELADISGNPGTSALGWDPPWDAMPGSGTDMQLAKNGAWGDGWGFRAYITRLPNNCDAVILVNTAVSQHPGGLLKDAYLCAADLVSTPPLYYDVVPHGVANDAGSISRVAVNTVKSSSTENEHVAAVRDSGGKLRLKAYRVTRDTGSIALADEKVPTTFNNPFGLSTQNLAITDGEHFATASMVNGSGLTVIGWSFDGNNLTQHGLDTGLSAIEVAATKATGSGAKSRVVTATTTLSGKLQLNVWFVNNENNTVILQDSYQGEAASAVAIKTLRYSADLTQSARVVTAMRNAVGELQVDVWEVDNFGKLRRGGQASFGTVSSSTAIPTRIAIDTIGDGESQFFNGTGFLTASVTDDGKMEVVSWQVDVLDNVTRRSNQATVIANLVSDVAIAANTTALRLSEDEKFYLYLTKWEVGSGGQLTRARNEKTGTQITKVAATSNFVTALQLNNNKLQLINWKIVD